MCDNFVSVFSASDQVYCYLSVQCTFDNINFGLINLDTEMGHYDYATL